ncbi:outer membrane protein assembly factor BamB/predicted MPP superfamily phosphohydrolase [Flavobacterium nitrogenifigens]|uniref:Outer membrane protein assembly factor BamB/predicted MPP superfamily phosphohydrolase n=2 Tax=Flavobacterium TaxID=237 RepID=A0A7W7J0W8_9FLAO|nr:MULTISPECIES: PQQ-binding-like beta-propeller repeat protein [Flavobacterium]MBB4804216.1 outer membrane protein assembly factor BamB/predicted MPP superfamily phosphohydrolase [Flavobacterium nitrogenifigens]MBB6389175.1 outer membrane protein assembly factor BamB/predicted MPP superfamily phosphohydrolase [Flavobacterium notoginsengisoli]
MKHLFLRILLFFITISCFSQNAEKSENIKFIQLTDLHVSVGNDNDFLLQNIVKEINNSDFEFVVVTGDLTNRGANDELEQVHSILSKLKKPYYVISGNHETNWSESAGLTYKKIFGEDRFVFSKGDYVFIGFPCGPYMKMGDGFVKHENVLWLDKTLKDNLKNSNKKVLNFAHYPLDNSVSNYKEVLAVLEKYPTVASFCGHGHTLRKYDFSGLSGLMGTSITSLDGKTQSYNQVIISKDSISIYQKEIDKPGVFKFSVPSKPSKITIPKDSVTMQTPFLKDIASIYSLPAFDKKNLYFTNSIGEIKSINLKNKSQNWKTETGNSIYFSPIIVKNNLVIGTIEGNLLGLDTQSGKQKWTIPVGGVLVGSPVAENNKIYTASSTAFICADAVTGKVIWQNNLPMSYSQGTPLIQGDKIIFGVWDSYIYCLNKNTGNLIWKWNNGNDKQILYSAGNVNMVSTKNRLYFVTPQRFLTVLDIETGKTLLRTSKWKIRESMGKSQDGKWFYGKTMDGLLLRVPLNDEMELTEENVAAQSKVLDLKLGYEHNPAGILENKNKIYIGSRKGEVIVVDAAKFEIIKQINLGSSSINGFTIDDKGQVWASLIEGGIFLLE